MTTSTTQDRNARLLKIWEEWYHDHTNKSLTDKLFSELRPYISSFISTYLGPSYARDPLMFGRAKLILYDALSKYDPSRGPIISYVWLSLQRLQRVLTKQQNILHISEQAVMAMRSLREAEEALRDSLGREPTDAELADHLGISVRRLETLRKKTQLGFESSFETAGEEGSASLPGVKREDSLDDALMELYYDSLTNDRDKYIFEYTYGFRGKRVKNIDTLAKDLNLSRTAVNAQLKKIRDDLELLSKTLKPSSSSLEEVLDVT